MGRRIQRIVGNGRENTKFVYDGLDVVMDDNSGVLTKYQNGPGIDNKLKMSANGVSKYFIADHLGSTNALTDASGTVLEQTAYDSFGNATNQLSTRYAFTGREFDNFTGLHYYRARWYDSNLGRFISEDPIGFSGGDVNLYGYVGNGPLGAVDPFGLQEGPVNYLRNPLPVEYWEINGVSNTVSDLLMLDSVAEWSWIAGDYRCSTEDRLAAGAKLVGWTAFNAVGGFVIGKVLGKVGRVLGPGVRRVLFGTGDEIIELGISAGSTRLSTAEMSGILRNAAVGKGNFGIGAASHSESIQMGRAWVGDGYRIASDGKTLVSADGLRVFRPPTYKPNLGRVQANFESKLTPGAQPYANGHLDVY
ncbi:MAG: hypothetical protein IPK58_24000 [Acidobacteria bacterium]|nr:hypothetical protein [Acidobacteriota bacterium]